MTDYRLPGGGRAWFVRRRTARGYKIDPCAPAGWWLTIGFCLFATIAPTALLIGAPGGKLSTARVAGVVMLILLPAIAYFIAAFRLSVPERRD